MIDWLEWCIIMLSESILAWFYTHVYHSMVSCPIQVYGVGVIHMICNNRYNSLICFNREFIIALDNLSINNELRRRLSAARRQRWQGSCFMTTSSSSFINGFVNLSGSHFHGNALFPISFQVTLANSISSLVCSIHPWFLWSSMLITNKI